MANTPNDKKSQQPFAPIPGLPIEGASDCCSSSFDENSIVDLRVKRAPISGNVTIDGKVIELMESDKNIVELASRSRIGIPAPCYRAQKSKGCCKACVVEIDGQQKFACGTTPEDGMNIIVKRPDLKALRKERIKLYKEGIETGVPCQCSGTDSSGNCCG